MSKISIEGNASGTGTLTIAAPNTNSNYTLTLPQATTTLVGTDATQTLTNKTLTTPNIDSAQFATVSGTAPLYACRAWVNFDGTGTVAIREDGNVSSITDNGTGNYTVNFTTAMPDANYTTVGNVNTTASGIGLFIANSQTAAGSQITTRTGSPSSTADVSGVFVAIFR